MLFLLFLLFFRLFRFFRPELEEEDDEPDEFVSAPAPKFNPPSSSSSSSFSSEYWFLHCVERCPLPPHLVQNPREPSGFPSALFFAALSLASATSASVGLITASSPAVPLRLRLRVVPTPAPPIRPGALMDASMAVLVPASLVCSMPMRSVHISFVLFAFDVLCGLGKICECLSLAGDENDAGRAAREGMCGGFGVYRNVPDSIRRSAEFPRSHRHGARRQSLAGACEAWGEPTNLQSLAKMAGHCTRFQQGF